MFVKWWNTFSIKIFFPVRFRSIKQVRLSLASQCTFITSSTVPDLISGGNVQVIAAHLQRTVHHFVLHWLNKRKWNHELLASLPLLTVTWAHLVKRHCLLKIQPTLSDPKVHFKLMLQEWSSEYYLTQRFLLNKVSMKFYWYN